MKTRRCRGRFRLRRSIFVLALAVFALAAAACDMPPKWVGPLLRAEIESSTYRSRSKSLSADIPYVENAGELQRLDVYGVPGRTQAPVVVFIHGGYFQTGSRTDYAALAETLAPLGFVTVLIDYRLYPEAHYPAYFEDAAAALNWIAAHIAEYGGDPSRIIVSGHSAGASIAALLVVNDRFRRLLHFDLRQVRGVALLSGAYDFGPGNLLDVNVLHAIMGSDANYDDAQPIHHVRADVPPLLIVNGDCDALTSEVQAARFARAMRTAGADVRYETIPGGDHISVVLDMTPQIKGRAYRAFADFALAKTAPAAPGGAAATPAIRHAAGW